MPRQDAPTDTRPRIGLTWCWVSKQPTRKIPFLKYKESVLKKKKSSSFLWLCLIDFLMEKVLEYDTNNNNKAWKPNPIFSNNEAFLGKLKIIANGSYQSGSGFSLPPWHSDSKFQGFLSSPMWPIIIIINWRPIIIIIIINWRENYKSSAVSCENNWV